MRAKIINEVNFERMQDPKKSMDIGGVQFGVEWTNIRKRQKQEIIDFFTNLLLGRSVRGLMFRTEWRKGEQFPDPGKWEECFVEKVDKVKVDEDNRHITIYETKKDKALSYNIEIGERKYFIK